MSTPAAVAEHEAPLLAAMEQYWGYDSFLPLQAEAMSAAMADQDSLVVLPTGGGKSLCFQAPAVCREGTALVVSPLISLMKDQVDALQACGVSAAAVNSSLGYDQKRIIAEQMRRGELKLVYMAPERLVAPQTIEFLKGIKLSLIAVDEAHCVSHWGHDFRPEYRELRVLKQAFPHVGVHAFTATASEAVRRDIIEQLGLVDCAELVGSFDRPNLIFRVQGAQDKFGKICELIERRRGEAGIVYCISRKEVDKTAAALEALGYRALPYHAGLSDTDRHRNQDAFLEERADVIVATVAFGMGIDKSNVRYVIHAGMPKSVEHYVQESGRAGRDGLEADCLLLHSGRDAIVWRQLIGDGEPAAVAGALVALEAMTQFCHGAQCRHRALVAHFGQDLDRDNCGACDVCLGELALVDEPLVLAQKILSCVARLGERYGGEYTAKVLVRSREERILSAGHDQLSTYGLLEAHSVTAVRHWIDQLVAQGFLSKDGEYQTLSLTDSGRHVFRGEATPKLSQPADQGKERRGSRSRVDLQSWEGVDRELFEQLRALRTTIAAERGVPAYVVFSDASLRDMGRRRPSNLEAFLHVHGVGRQKCSDYGAAFVAAVTAHCQTTGTLSDVIPIARNSSDEQFESGASRGGPKVSAVGAFAFFRNGASIETVMQKMNRARSTVVGYLSEFLMHEQIMDHSPWVEPALARRIEAAVDEAGYERLKPIFDQLGGEVSYDDIKIVAACIANRASAS